MNGNSSSEPDVKRQRRHLTPEEKNMIRNVFEGLRAREESMNVSDVVTLCSILTKVSESSVYKIIRIKDNTNIVKPETRGRKPIKLEEKTKQIIRRTVHEFYLKNELPNVRKIISSLQSKEVVPQISKRVLLRNMHDMNFRYIKKNRNSALIEKEEIILWRRRYLKQMEEYRRDRRKIYYTDETWLNEGHTVTKVWHDLNVKSKRDAFVNDLSAGFKAPSGKGKRLIITHIGSESGFLEGGFNAFVSKKTGDYHEEMDAERYEEWFSDILLKVEPGSVIVLDNAPYHGRRAEQLPTTKWKKSQISDWLTEKNIPFNEKMLRAELLDLARCHKHKYVRYIIDEMARRRGVILLRLPPYHCELNPIELVWAQIKNEVAKKNVTFKLNDIRNLLNDAVCNVTSESWKKCIEHVTKEEQKMWNLDNCIDITVEPIVINLGESSSGSTSDDSVEEFIYDSD